MYRRVVSLLLLPCVLLTQTAAIGHAHGGGQPAGHDLRPHFHTNPPAALRHHDEVFRPHGHHHHGPGGHHHHHDDGDDAPEPDTQPTPEPEPLSDHDSDAVFLTTVDVVLGGRSPVHDELTASSFVAAVGSSSFVASGADLPHEVPNWTHPPPSGYACPLYVRHLTLLI